MGAPPAPPTAGTAEPDADVPPPPPALRVIAPATSADDTNDEDAMPLSPTSAAAARTAARWKAAFHHIFHPRTHGERAACVAVWTTLVLAAILFAVFALPRIMDKAIYPAMEYVKTKWPKAATVALCAAGITLLPLLFIPFRVFIWVASYALGPGWAFLLVTICTTITMAAGFLIARRTRLHARCEKWFGSYSWFSTMMLAVKEAKPWRVVLLLRLSPVPYTFFNYAAALSKDVTFWPYMLASIAGHAPDNAIHVFVGAGVASLGDLIRGKKQPTPGRIAAVAVPFAAAIICVIASIIYGKRALKQVKAQADAARAHQAEQDAAAAVEEGRANGTAAAADEGRAANGTAAA